MLGSGAQWCIGVKIIEQRASLFGSMNERQKAQFMNELATQLHSAAQAGQVDRCLTLLEKGALVNVLDNEGWSPLHRAAWWGCTEFCVALLDAGADSHAKTTKQQTALDLALQGGHESVAAALRAWQARAAAQAALCEMALASIKYPTL